MLKFIVLLGVVSLLADITYEGARSIIGPYLGLLGASAFWIGFVSGAGELIGYGLRLFFGYISDRTKSYWTITIVGYAVNLLAVPALALAGRWEIAAGLVILERLGKAIRTPARDVLLSRAAKQIGSGRGFGIHEALDQIGAVMGPLIIGAVLFFKGDYRLGLSVLIVPALAALGVLILARYLASIPLDKEKIVVTNSSTEKLKAPYWIYLVAVGFMAAGYVDYPLIAYHLERNSLFSKEMIPFTYAVAMAVDAVSALLFGYLYDRSGFRIVPFSVLLASLFSPLIFLGASSLPWLGIICWGIGLGAQESIMRAAVADLVPESKRGTGYGMFQTGYGLCWFAGSALMAYLYQIAIIWLVLFSWVALLSSFLLLIYVNSILKQKN
ncbi:MAG: MFS transporter [Syntrophales bacterium]|nr:MFS transporter [Syntrophales bacterium]